GQQTASAEARQTFARLAATHPVAIGEKSEIPAAASFSQKNAAVGILGGCRLSVSRHSETDDRQRTTNRFSLEPQRLGNCLVRSGEPFDEPLLDGKGHRRLP